MSLAENMIGATDNSQIFNASSAERIGVEWQVRAGIEPCFFIR